jgi:hypothetical protein
MTERRKFYRHPKPQQALTVMQPQPGTLLPPIRREPKLLLEVTVTNRRVTYDNSVREQTEIETWQPPDVVLTTPGLSFLTAVLNFLSTRRN